MNFATKRFVSSKELNTLRRDRSNITQAYSGRVESKLDRSSERENDRHFRDVQFQKERKRESNRKIESERERKKHDESEGERKIERKIERGTREYSKKVLKKTL